MFWYLFDICLQYLVNICQYYWDGHLISGEVVVENDIISQLGYGLRTMPKHVSNTLPGSE